MRNWRKDDNEDATAAEAKDECQRPSVDAIVSIVDAAAADLVFGTMPKASDNDPIAVIKLIQQQLCCVNQSC